MATDPRFADHRPMEVGHRDEVIYEDRFNLKERRPVSAERIDRSLRRPLGPRPMGVRSIALAWVVACAAGCVTTRLPAAGTVAGQRLATTVDSDVAAFYLEHHVRGERPDSVLAQVIDRTVREVKPDPHDREALRRLSERLSPDLAAIYFASALYRRPANQRFQDAFHAAVRRLTDSDGDSRPPEGRGSYLVAFVPGFEYKNDPTTGADFARQRDILRQRGFRQTLIETDEFGTVEDNADIVADAVRRFTAQRDQVILVSASKGGPEVALALGDRLSLADAASVKAWISVGGLIRGTPYADHNLRWPRRWFAELALRLAGYRPSLIRNLSTIVRRPVFDRLRLPPHVLMVQYIGVPLSGHIGGSVRRRYDTIRRFGPNDGSTLLADELIPGGVVVTDIGLDHYFRDPIIELKTLALAHVVLAELEQREKSRGSSAAIRAVGTDPARDPQLFSRTCPVRHGGATRSRVASGDEQRELALDRRADPPWQTPPNGVARFAMPELRRRWPRGRRRSDGGARTCT